MQELSNHFGVFVVLATAICACRGGEAPQESEPAVEFVETEEGSAEAEATPQEGSADALAAAPEVAAEPEAEPEVFLPEYIAPVAGATSFPIGRPGGTLTVGDASLEIPDGALPETTTIEFEVVADPGELGRPLPGSLLLGAVRAGPWNPGFTRAVRIRVPLTRRIEPGTPLELLAYQPAMRAFIVAGFANANEAGTHATFSVRQLGDLVVRARPVESETAQVACPGEPYALHDAWPIRSEDDAVGLTEVETRFPRELAFSLLTDFRLSPSYDLIDFKNEEVNNLGATSRDERNHQDEDYLMDPNAAAAVTALAALVANEWVDPISGEPAVRVRITESYDSLIEHSPRSTHYQGRAIDLTLSPIPAAAGEERRYWYGRLARLSQCAGFDWVLFENQFHVHASVEPTEYGFAVADSEGGVTLATGNLANPRAVRMRSRRWDDASEVAAVRWLGGDRVEASSPESDASFASVAVSADGLRQIVVSEGRAYLANTSPLPNLGSVNADGSPVDVEYPLALTPPDVEVVGASFAEHAADRPVERHVLGRD